MLTREILVGLWPHGDDKVPGLIDGIISKAPAVFQEYGFLNDGAVAPIIIAQAMAQFSHECSAGLEMIESINYSAERACSVWPSRFRSAADCYSKVDSFAGDPQFKIKLIDHVYGGRMGNAPYPSHDGSKFIGRGLSQTTGHDGYLNLSRTVGLDFVANPDLTCNPDNALECGVADFINCGCLPFAARDDIDNVTLHLNGGHIGLAERKVWLARWKKALSGDIEPARRTPAAIAPDRVIRLQRALIAEGFNPGAADGALGPKTIKAFQNSRGLFADGISGPKTEPELMKALADI